MADTTLCTFAELEFLLRSAAGPHGERSAAMDAVRRRLGLQPEAATDIVTAAGVASLLADKGTRFPFGPALALGGLLAVWLYQPVISNMLG